MTKQELLALFQSRGLRAWQADFAASFFDTDSSTFQLLAAPPGTGKTYVSVAIAAELVARQSKRILILSPNMILCEQWTERLGDISTIPVVLVTRRVFREMEAALPIGQQIVDCTDGSIQIADKMKAALPGEIFSRAAVFGNHRTAGC